MQPKPVSTRLPKPGSTRFTRVRLTGGGSSKRLAARNPLPPPMAAGSAASFTVLEILRKFQSVGFCSEPDIDASEPDNLSTVFNRVLSVFLREIRPPGGGIRPVIPAVLGDGFHVDLFDLYSAVKERGGFGSVTARKSWGSVAEAIGSDPGLGPSLKLVYVKYLDDLDGWMERVVVKKGKADGSSLEKQFMTPVSCRSKTEDTCQIDDEKRCSGGGSVNDGVACLVECRKRKRDTLAGILNWALRVAKNPCDPTSGGVAGDMYSMVLASRQAMFLKWIHHMDVDTPKAKVCLRSIDALENVVIVTRNVVYCVGYVFCLNPARVMQWLSQK